MKKNTALYIVVTAFISSMIANAIMLPTYERPIYFAQLIELDTAGNEFLDWSQKQTLTMNKRDGAEHATSFTLNQVRNVVCTKAPCRPRHYSGLFFVEDVEQDRCGSVKYVAIEFSPRDDLAPAKRLEVIDQGTGRCRDRQIDSWEVSLTDGDQVRLFNGHPETVYTIQ